MAKKRNQQAFRKVDQVKNSVPPTKRERLFDDMVRNVLGKSDKPVEYANSHTTARFKD